MTDSITCPRCSRTSYNPNDVREGYCGNCHDYTRVELGWNNVANTNVVQVTGKWVVSVTPMIFNDRVLLTHVDEWPWTWTAGWCYDKGAAAHLAAAAWDVETEREPKGYKKVAGDLRT